jgi:4-amino-4-deoxy-L-arabinose transferase-like glycosyltransferase
MMESSWSERVLKDRPTLWVVVALTALLFLFTNLPRQLDDYDQAKQAFTSFEMVKEGHWLFQRTPHERVATKPPLVGWISAGIFEVTRSWNLAWALPSLLAAAAISLLLFRAANSTYGAVAGLITLSTFTLNLLTPRLATLVRTDMPLAFVIFLLGLWIWQKIRAGEKWTRRDQLWMFLALTAGMLIKGPIVYVFLLPGILSYQWWTRRRERVSSWCGWWPWLASFAVFFLWVIGGTQSVPGFFDQVVGHEFIGRFGETIHRAHRSQPIYFYFLHLLHKFAPWSVLIILLAFVRVRELGSIKMASRRIAPETLWLVCWSLGGLLVMSLVPSKRVDRIFPIIPPLCLLLGAQLSKVQPNERMRAWIYRWCMAALFLALLFTGCYSAAKIVSGYRNHNDAFVQFGHTVDATAQAHHWRFEAISGSDEGMLLYLNKMHFIEPDEAVAEWNRGTLDALVVPNDEIAKYLGALADSSLSGLQSIEKRNEPGEGYVLLTR